MLVVWKEEESQTEKARETYGEMERATETQIHRERIDVCAEDLRKPAGSIRFPGAGDIGICELYDVGNGN